MTFGMDKYKLKVINIWIRRYQLKMWFLVKLAIQILPSVSNVPEYTNDLTEHFVAQISAYKPDRISAYFRIKF